eukprot:5165806-Alexandrium_andersonii.AAC.1
MRLGLGGWSSFGAKSVPQRFAAKRPLVGPDLAFRLRLRSRSGSCVPDLVRSAISRSVISP